MQAVKVAAAIALGCAITLAGRAQGYENVTLSQPDAPLRIVDYEAEFVDDEDHYAEDGIMHRVEVQNASGQNVVAYSIGLVALDAFGDYMDSFVGYAVSAVQQGQTDHASWHQSVADAYSFEEYGTGIAFVRAARFEDGTVWKAPMDQATPELKGYAPEFEPGFLESDD